MTGDERLDPITLEVVRNALASTADEMALVLMRSAYSPVVRDTMDYSTALCDRHGRIVAQGLTLAVQLGSFPTMMSHLCEEHAETTRPGDVFIANDPYGYGGQHLPDIYVVKPIFVDDELEGYAATLAHHADVGGIAPGSIAVHATEIFQEGLRLPLLKLHDGGVENQALLRIIEKNTRQPTQVLGDLQAQVAACRAGERGLAQLVERHGSRPPRLPRAPPGHRRARDACRDRVARRREVRGCRPRRRLRGRSGADRDPPRPHDPRRRARDRLHRDERAGRREPQLPARPHLRGLLLRDPRRHARRHPELRGLHEPDPGRRARGHRREPGLARRVRRARRHRLSRVRHDHARPRPGRSGPGRRRRRGRPDARGVRGLRRAPSALRDDGSHRRGLGGPGDARRARGSLEPARQPLEPADRAARERPSARDRPVPPRPRFRRRRRASRRARVRARVPRPGRARDPDDPIGPPSPPALRPRRRPARRSVPATRPSSTGSRAMSRRCRWRRCRFIVATASVTGRRAVEASVPRSCAILHPCSRTFRPGR